MEILISFCCSFVNLQHAMNHALLAKCKCSKAERERDRKHTVELRPYIGAVSRTMSRHIWQRNRQILATSAFSLNYLGSK